MRSVFRGPAHQLAMRMRINNCYYGPSNQPCTSHAPCIHQQLHVRQGLCLSLLLFIFIVCIVYFSHYFIIYKIIICIYSEVTSLTQIQTTSHDLQRRNCRHHILGLLSRLRTHVPGNRVCQQVLVNLPRLPSS